MMRLGQWTRHEEKLRADVLSDAGALRAQPIGRLFIVRHKGRSGRRDWTEWRVSAQADLGLPVVVQGAAVSTLREAKVRAVETFCSLQPTEAAKRAARAYLLPAHVHPPGADARGRSRRWSFLSRSQISRDVDCVCSWTPDGLGTCELFHLTGVCLTLDFRARTLAAVRASDDPAATQPTVGLTAEEARALWNMLAVPAPLRAPVTLFGYGEGKPVGPLHLICGDSLAPEGPPLFQCTRCGFRGIASNATREQHRTCGATS